jgi:hypothetical protein
MGVTAPGVGEAPWGAWAAETVKSDGLISGPTVMELDSAGRPVIGYDGDVPCSDCTAVSATIMHRELGRWERTVVEPSASFLSVAVGPQDRWHVVYYNFTDLPDSFAGSIRYAVQTGDGGWNRETVTDMRPSGAGEDVHLALRDGADPVVSVGKSTDLYVFTRSGDGSWSRTRVGGSGVRHDLALDRNGDAHIAFGTNEGPGGTLWYLAQEGGSWGSEEKVLQGCGADISIAPYEGHPRVACHFVHEGSGLAYVWRGEDGVWRHEVADDGSGAPLPRQGTHVGHSTSIAVDGEGEPHIGYRYIVNFAAPDVFQGTAHYASKVDGEWVVERIEHPGNQVSGATSIVLDDGGRPHVSWVLRARVHGLGCTHPANSCFDLQYARPLQGEAPAPPGVS